MMFSSTFTVNPFPYTDQPTFTYDVNPNSRQEQHPLFFHYSPPLIDHHHHDHDHDSEDMMILQHQPELLLSDHLLSPQQLQMTDNTPSDHTEIHMVASNQNNSNCKKKKSGKKDRHSKINTAQGLRDRRMRLSLSIARKFFDLQDMLGFDKASKTVEWLLTKSKSPIKELLHMKHNSTSVGTKSVSSASSDCEVVSSGIIGEIAIDDEHQREREIVPKRKSSVHLSKERNIRYAFHPRAREYREKARAWARERTRKKLWSRRLEESKPVIFEASNHNLNQLWSGDQESGSHSNNLKSSSLEAAAEVEEFSFNSLDQHIAKQYFMNKSSNPSSIFNCQNSIGISNRVNSDNINFPDLPENWQVYITRMESSNCYKANNIMN